MEYGLVETPSKYKKELVDFFKQQIGVKSFCEGFRNQSFNIFVDKDSKNRKKERGLSSERSTASLKYFKCGIRQRKESVKSIDIGSDMV